MNGNFFFDGVSSRDVGITIARINTSDDTMPLLASQTPTMQQVINQDFATFIRTRKDNLRISLFFTLDPCEAFTNERIREVGKFFARSIPFEFRVEEDLAKVIHIVPTGSIELIRFGEMKGYFQIAFQAMTPYWLSPMDIRTFNLLPNDTFTLNNGRNIQDRHGNYDIYPRLVIRNINTAASPHFNLRNVTNHNETVAFSQVIANDRITMHHRILDSERLAGEIFHRWNRVPFRLVGGINTLGVNIACSLDVHMQFPVF